MRRAVVAWVVVAVVAASFAGAWHPLGDSLAVFRLPLAGLAFVVLLLVRQPRWLVWPGLVFCGLAVVSVWSLKLTTHTPGPVLIYQKNMLFANRDTGPLIADILARAPDHVTLAEVTPRHLKAVTAGLAGAYPTRHWCGFRAVGGTMVASRWPEVPGTAFCATPGGLAGVQVEMPQGPVWVVALHLLWPWPHGQAAQREAFVTRLQALDGPIIVGGDFNMVAWSHTMARITAATRTRRAGPVAPSFAVKGVRLPIDHVLAPGGGSAEILPRLGSDHNGVLARVFVRP